MHKLEMQLYDGSHSMEALDVHQAMTLVEPGTVSFPSAVDISASTARKLCGVMSAYRLMDVMYALRSFAAPQSLPAPFRNPRYGKLPQQGLVPDSKVSMPSGLCHCGLKTLWLELVAGRLGRGIERRHGEHGWIGKVPCASTTPSWHIYRFICCRFRRFHIASSPVQGFAWVLETSEGIEHALQPTGCGFPPVRHAKRIYRK